MPVIPPDVVDAARAAQAATGIPASVSIAQWADESAWGSKVTGAFNYFGVKAVGDQPYTLCSTHEIVDGRRVPTVARFLNYDSLSDAFIQHAQLLTHPQYAEARGCLPDVAAFIGAMAPVYATAGASYAKTLNEIVAEHDLRQYDT